MLMTWKSDVTLSATHSRIDLQTASQLALGCVTLGCSHKPTTSQEESWKNSLDMSQQLEVTVELFQLGTVT